MGGGGGTCLAGRRRSEPKASLITARTKPLGQLHIREVLGCAIRHDAHLQTCIRLQQICRQLLLVASFGRTHHPLSVGSLGCWTRSRVDHNASHNLADDNVRIGVYRHLSSLLQRIRERSAPDRGAASLAIDAVLAPFALMRYRPVTAGMAPLARLALRPFTRPPIALFCISRTRLPPDPTTRRRAVKRNERVGALVFCAHGERP